MKKERILLFVILLAAFLVRVYGLNFPLYHWDERIAFGNVFYASYHDLALPIYEHGSFLQYIILLIWFLYRAFSLMPFTTFDLMASFIGNMAPYLILARIPLVLAGTGTVFLTYILAKRVYSKSVGNLAAFFLAFNFLHVAHSHYARGHILAGFFIVLAVYYSVMIYQAGKQKYYIWVGLSLGLAVAAQYSGVLVFFVILIAHILRKKEAAPDLTYFSWLLNRSFLLSLNVAAISFFIVTPYALLDFSYYGAEMKWFLLQTLTKVHVDPEGQSVLLFYLTEHLKNGMGFGIEVLALGGVLYAAVKRRTEDIILLIFPVILFFSFSKGENFARYALPLIPFLMIFAARLLVSGGKFLPSRWRTSVLSVVAILLIVPSLVNVARYDYWITQIDTREQAREWFIENIPDGAKVVSEGADVLSVNLPLSVEFLEQIISEAEVDSFNQTYHQALLDNASAETGYQFYKIFRLDESHNGTSVEPREDIVFYKDHDVMYLITVSWMQHSETNAYSPEFQKSLDTFYKEIAVFEPSVYFRWDPYAWRMDYEALSRIRLGEAGVGGPRLVIYQLR